MQVYTSIDKIRRVAPMKNHFEEFGGPSKQIETIAFAFRHIDHISTPGLRKRLS